MATRWGSLFLLTALGLLYFAELVRHPDQTLYSASSDFVSLHLPAKRFLVRSFHETGEVPLWCPYSFGGMPFVHDIQSSAFYPPHWLLYFLPEAQVGAALSWLVVFHVMAAGWCMFVYARCQGLGNAGAFVAGAGYMFAGKWLLHLLAGGHYNMVPLAWLPLVLLGLERAIRRRSIADATWAGGAFALLVLGAYPYVTLYAGLFVAIWTLGTALEQAGIIGGGNWEERRTLGGAIGIWAGMGAWTALIGIGLGAVQLFPAVEGAREASRSAGVSLTAQYFLDGLRALVGLVGPPLSDEPNAWENRAGVGVLWLALVLAAPKLRDGRSRYQAGVLGVLLLYVFGGAAAVQHVPGFHLFRLPSRMFLIAALPVALLAGRVTDALVGERRAGLAEHVGRVLLKTVCIVALLAGVFTLALRSSHGDIGVRLHPYWLSLAVTVPIALWLLRPSRAPCRLIGLPALLVLDLVALSWGLVETRPDAELYAPSKCVRYVAERAALRGRVLDINPVAMETSANETPLWPGLSTVVGVEAVRGFNPIDVLRYKEFLQFISGEDRPLQAVDQMFTGPLVGTFAIKEQALADLLGIRFLVQPADLALEATVPTGHAAVDWRRVAEDAAPSTFNFVSVAPGGRDGGLHSLPPYVVYERPAVQPRAFVVPSAVVSPERSGVLAALRATDFRKRVLLEGAPPSALESQGGMFQAAVIREYMPNRITIDVPAGAKGYLVLNDVWFPGWSCTVGGVERPLWRANYLFRGVKLAAGSREVVFTFAPGSYLLGRWISSGSLIVCLVILLAKVLSLGVRSHAAEREEEGAYAGVA